MTDKSTLGAWIVILFGGAVVFFSLSQVFGLWWLVLTGALALAVWSIMWLWPARATIKNR